MADIILFVLLVYCPSFNIGSILEEKHANNEVCFSIRNEC